MKNTMLKRFIAVMTAVVMILPIFSVNVFAVEAEKMIVGDYLIEIIENVNDGEYTKMKFTNMHTGEVQWLESFHNFEDGTSFSIARVNDDVYTIKGLEENIVVAHNGDIVMDMARGELAIILGLEASEAVKVVDYTSSNFEPLSWGSWSGVIISRGNSAIPITIMSTVIGIVATIFGVPAGAAIVIAVASAIISLSLTQIWWERHPQHRTNVSLGLIETRATTFVYRYSNFTGLIGQNTQTHQTFVGTR